MPCHILAYFGFMLSFVDTLKVMLMLLLFVILLKKRQLDPRFQVGRSLLLLIHSNCEGRFFYYSSIEESIETQNGDFPPFSQMLLGSRRGWELVDFQTSERQLVYLLENL